MKQTVLITGGSGLLGTVLSKLLLSKGYNVIVLTRKMPAAPAPLHMKYALWDIKNNQIDIAALQEADFIVNLAGAGVVAKKWTKAYKAEIIESRTETSRLLIAALCNNSNKVKSVINASAIGFYGADKATATPFTETDKADDSFLGETCTLWEKSIVPVTALGKRLVIFRIGIVLSNDGGALVEFKKPVRFGMAAILGNGKQVVSWIHIDDLCHLFVEAIENKNRAGTYNAVAPHPVTNKVLTVTLAKKMNGKFFIPLYIPAFVLRIMLGQRSIEVLKSTTVSCRKIVDAGFKFQFNFIEPAMENLAKTTDRH